MSKQRPSARNLSAKAAVSDLPVSHWQRRIFKNSYTRRGRTYRLDGWSVKIQRQGRRCTFSLRARVKAAAAAEAKALYDAVVAEGWEAAARIHAALPTRGPTTTFDAHYWRKRLLHRRYRFSGSTHGDEDLAVQIEHEGSAWYFPLGTPDPVKAAAKARVIYEKVVERGWDATFRTVPREVIVGFEWSVQPLIWTYTTLHTLTLPAANGIVANEARATGAQRVLILEPETGVARALAWCVNQHPGFCASVGEPSSSLLPAINAHNADLLLVNRNLGVRFGLQSPAQLAASPKAIPALMYSVCSDGDKLFVSTPGGAQGYFLKRVAPERLLEPVMEMAGRGVFAADDLLARVRSQFKELLRSRADEDASGLNKLTRREREVLTLMSRGCVDKEIARILGISIWTVHGHIKSIFERLQVRTRTEAVIRYLEK